MKFLLRNKLAEQKQSNSDSVSLSLVIRIKFFSFVVEFNFI